MIQKRRSYRDMVRARETTGHHHCYASLTYSLVHSIEFEHTRRSTPVAIQDKNPIWRRRAFAVRHY